MEPTQTEKTGCAGQGAHALAGIRSTLWSGRTCPAFWSTKEQAYLVYGDELLQLRAN